MSALTLIYIFFEKYAVPFLFVIGLLYFIYGVIEYFIIGQGGDEERSQHGRELFLQSIIWFALSLILATLVAFFGWITTLSFSPPSGSVAPQGGFNVEERPQVLPVPNTPTR